jgi:GNAT superfamily N-acetyltransferase
MTAARIRRATLADVEFVTAAVIDAERSGRPFTMYERVFDLTEAELRDLLHAIFVEDVPGSELWCESFLLALDGDHPVAAIATWIEERDAPPSAIVRANLLSHTLGIDKWKSAAPKLRSLATIDLPRRPGTLQIEAVHTAPAHRGRGLSGQLIAFALDECRRLSPDVTHSQVISVLENEVAARAFARAGYVVAGRSQGDAALGELFPGTGRVLWERAI